MVLALKREIIERKTREADELAELINKYKVLGIANLYKVRSKQLQELMKRFGPEIHMKVAKNILIKRALKKCTKINVETLANHLTGSNILLFTNMNPFKLSILLERSKIKITAKVGDSAPNDIVIPAGNTGLPPGPAISELNEAGIRTRIDAGSVWVLRDTVVAKKGEAISPKIASALSKLGIKPLEVGLKIIVAYDDGLVLTSDQLILNLDETRRQIEDFFGKAINLAVNLAYPTSETITTILQNAYFRAKNAAINSAYPAPEIVTEIIVRAHVNMLSLASKLAQINKDAVPPALG